MSDHDQGGGASRSTDPAAGSSTGTDVSLREHLAALRAADRAFEAERDRRYTEVNIEKEKALKIKETADRAALSLAREIQDYKDEKANELRSQIERERGDYATQADLKGAIEKLEETLKPLASFIAASQGRQSGIGLSANVAAGLTASLVAVLGLVITAYLATH